MAEVGAYSLRIALLICYEIEFPEAARNAALNGADLILAPTALGAQWGVVAHKLVPTRAFENGIFIAYANHAGREGEIEYLGESCIVDPMGNDLARLLPVNGWASMTTAIPIISPSLPRRVPS